MREISLNIWKGKEREPLRQFIHDHAGRADLFSLQEVEDPIYCELQQALPDYDSFRWVNQAHPGYCPAFFVRKSFSIEQIHTDFLVKGESGSGMSAVIKGPSGGVFVMCNIHGRSRPGDKLDIPERIEQSRGIVEHLDQFRDYPIIIAGDFNLMPQTRSIKMIEQAGFRNLIKDFGVTDTRGPINRRKYLGSEEGIQNFADYTFVSNKVRILGFDVPQVAVSDHLPMILDFDLRV